MLKVRDVSIDVGQSYLVDDFVQSCSDDISEKCILSIEGDEKYSKPGVYEVLIVAKDDAGNEAKMSAKLVINDNKSNEKEPVKEKEEVKKDKDKNSAKVVLVDTDTESIKSEEELKYGTKLIIWKVSTYNIYSDGSKKKIDEYTHKEVDTSNFKANTSDMLSEAISNMSSYKGLIDGVVEYTNSFRSEIEGLEALEFDNDLTKAAMVRAIEMAYSHKFSHTRPDGSSCFTVLSDIGLNKYIEGENIAQGYRDAKSVAMGWKNSKGHYENMINSSFKKIGIGVINLNNTYYWVQLFSN